MNWADLSKAVGAVGQKADEQKKVEPSLDNSLGAESPIKGLPLIKHAFSEHSPMKPISMSFPTC